MLSELELKMNDSVRHVVKVICRNGDELIGKCVDFDTEVMDWERDEEGSCITLRAPSKNGGAAPGALVEVFESEIQSMEILDQNDNGE